MRRAAGLVLLAAFAAAPLCAQFVPDGKWWKRPRIAAAIELTPEQEKQLDQIFAHNRPKLIDLKADLDKKNFEFEQAMEAGDTTDRKIVAARIEANEEARAKLQKELALMVLDMKHVMKPEQWDRLIRMQQEIRERMQEKRQEQREEQRRLEGKPPNEFRRPQPRAAAPPTAPPAGHR